MRTAALVLICTVVGPGASANLLVNAGFDSGDLFGWNSFAADWGSSHLLVQSEDVSSGDYGLKTWIEPGEKASFGVYQQVASTPGVIYEISGWWKGDGETTAYWEVFLFNGVFDWGQFETGPPEVIALNRQARRDTFDLPPCQWDWEPISDAWYCDPLYGTGYRNGRITATGDVLTVVLKLGGGFGLSTAIEGCWDEFSLEPVSEPASILVLVFALSCAALACRRRPAGA